MEIETTPVTLEQRIEFIQQAPANGQLVNTSFNWTPVIIVGVIGICAYLAYNHITKLRKEKQDDTS